VNAILFIDAGTWFGGAQRSLLTLLSALHTDGSVEPIVACADHSHNGLAAQCEQAGITTYRMHLRHWRKSPTGVAQLAWDYLQTRPLLLQLYRRHAPCLVHANGCRSLALLMGALPTQIPLLVHARDLQAPQWLRRFAAQRRHTHVIAISAAVAEAWQPLVHQHQLHVIFNGIAAPTLPLTQPPTWPWAQSNFTAVQVADFVSWKRHDRFLQAIALASAQAPHLRALIIGRTPNTAAQRHYHAMRSLCQRLNLDHCVHFCTSEDNALPWIAGADLLVSATEQEPFGRTIVEALHCGVPVVAVNGAGPAEILADCAAATLVDPSAAAIAAAVQQWLHQSHRAEIAAIAQAQAQRFCPAIMTAKVLALYRDLGVYALSLDVPRKG